MADSPKCEECKRVGIDSQTYKIAGRPEYRCVTCKAIFQESVFDKEAFTWKEEPEIWNDWWNKKQKNESLKNVEKIKQ